MSVKESAPVESGPREQRVRGSLLFADDMLPTNAVHGAFVRLPEDRARILAVEATAAREMPGVVRVVTAEDFGHDGAPRFGPVVADQPILASAETRYRGEPVAVVLASSRERAIAAAQVVHVQREVLPAWFRAKDALSSEPLHANSGGSQVEGGLDGNVMGTWDFAWGDIDQAQETAALTVENSYYVPFAHHFAIETYSATGIPDRSGITVFDTVQHPFVLRRVIADMLKLPLSQVHVHATPMGGSFGGKGYPKLGPVVAALSLLVQQPVKITLSAEESFLTGQREASEVAIRTGFNAEGLILFQQIAADFLIGAYADISPRVVPKAGLHACGPYRVPAATVRARGLYTTTPPTTAFRGFGAPHLVMAIEGQMDEAATVLDVDPVRLRLKNMKHKGEATVSGESPVDGDWPALVRMAADKLGWGNDLPRGRGRGIAFGMKSCVPSTTSQARIRLSNDGSVTAYIGTSEMGQGAIVTFTELVADMLEVPTTSVRVQMADTELVPFDSLTASSRSIVHMGQALRSAAMDVRKQLIALGADLRDGESSDVSLSHGRVVLGDKEVTYGELLERALGRGQGEIDGRGGFRSMTEPAHPLGGKTPFFEAVATGVEVAVDEETGIVKVHRVVHVTDAGRVLNRRRATGLDEGGVVMGLGLALSEGLFYSRYVGLGNGSSLDYRIPTICDIPEESMGLFLENGDGPGPMGSKGLAEGGILAVAPAIAQALYQCTGTRFHSLPITAETVWSALQVVEGSS